MKPFSPTELVARIEAALRKRSAPGLYGQREPYRLGGLTIDFALRRVTVENRPVRLTATEYSLLHTLAVIAGRVLSHDQLLERVWNENEAGNSKLLRSFVRQLRRKLGDDARQPTYIFTEPRVAIAWPEGLGPGDRPRGAVTGRTPPLLRGQPPRYARVSDDHAEWSQTCAIETVARLPQHRLSDRR